MDTIKLVQFIMALSTSQRHILANLLDGNIEQARALSRTLLKSDSQPEWILATANSNPELGEDVIPYMLQTFFGDALR